MAGSYFHCVYRKNGKIVKYEDHMGLLDHMGDASEAIEEMLVMIDFLSEGDPKKIFEAHMHYLKVSGSDYKQTFEQWFKGLCTSELGNEEN